MDPAVSSLVAAVITAASNYFKLWYSTRGRGKDTNGRSEQKESPTTTPATSPDNGRTKMLNLEHIIEQIHTTRSGNGDKVALTSEDHQDLCSALCNFLVTCQADAQWVGFSARGDGSNPPLNHYFDPSLITAHDLTPAEAMSCVFFSNSVLETNVAKWKSLINGVENLHERQLSCYMEYLITYCTKDNGAIERNSLMTAIRTIQGLDSISHVASRVDTNNPETQRLMRAVRVATDVQEEGSVKGVIALFYLILFTTWLACVAAEFKYDRMKTRSESEIDKEDKIIEMLQEVLHQLNNKNSSGLFSPIQEAYERYRSNGEEEQSTPDREIQVSRQALSSREEDVLLFDEIHFEKDGSVYVGVVAGARDSLVQILPPKDNGEVDSLAAIMAAARRLGERYTSRTTLVWNNYGVLARLRWKSYCQRAILNVGSCSKFMGNIGIMRNDVNYANLFFQRMRYKNLHSPVVMKFENFLRDLEVISRCNKQDLVERLMLSIYYNGGTITPEGVVDIVAHITDEVGMQRRADFRHIAVDMALLCPHVSKQVVFTLESIFAYSKSSALIFNAKIRCLGEDDSYYVAVLQAHNVPELYSEYARAQEKRRRAESLIVLAKDAAFRKGLLEKLNATRKDGTNKRFIKDTKKLLKKIGPGEEDQEGVVLGMIPEQAYKEIRKIDQRYDTLSGRIVVQPERRQEWEGIIDKEENVREETFVSIAENYSTADDYRVTDGILKAKFISLLDPYGSQRSIELLKISNGYVRRVYLVDQKEIKGGSINASVSAYRVRADLSQATQPYAGFSISIGR